MSYYIGLISGTSMDGVDAALVSFEDGAFSVHATTTFPYPAPLRERLTTAIDPDARLTLHEFGSLHVSVGRVFAEAANELINEHDVMRADIAALGSHGQTLRHSPDSNPPYTLQIGDPATIASRCQLPTVADFRSLDIAAGGQGAPLVPPFHEAFFRTGDTTTVVLNIGGIANITVLPSDPRQAVSGFDTGPGNCLLDEWIRLKRGDKFDAGGRWAQSGTVCESLLNRLMDDPYIKRAPAKSTGREYFNLTTLHDALRATDTQSLEPENVQATLCAFTVASIVDGIERTSEAGRVLVCGGGVHNKSIMAGLQSGLPGRTVASIDSVGADPDFIEASAFAWLARQRIKEIPVRLTTAASPVERLLGAVHLPSAISPGDGGTPRGGR